MNTEIQTMTEGGDDLAWFRAYSAGQPATVLAKRMGYSATVVRRLKAGTYNADMTQVLEAIRRLRTQVGKERNLADANRQAGLAARMLGRKVEYVHTEDAGRVHAMCHAARMDSTLSTIVGGEQMGKTMALTAYAADPSVAPLTVLVTLPTRPTAFKVGQLLCEAMGLDKPGDDFAAAEALRRVLTPNHLILVDEAEKAIYAGRRGITDVLMWLKDLHDATKCGMVLCGDPVFGEALETCGLLRKIVRRGMRLDLQPLPGKKAIRAMAAKAGLGEPDADTWAILTQLAKESGYGGICLRLHMAARQALLMQREPSWQMFIAAHQYPQGGNQDTNLLTNS